MQRNPAQFAHTPHGDAALSVREITDEIARLAGLLAHKVGVHDAFTILMRIAGALQPGGRA